ncbi:MAG: hypothetical protein J0G33_03940 [Afipia felis]|nr:hypothetical protein [Afipia felis]
MELKHHDAGGKRRMKLPDGVKGDAEYFGVRQQYRLWLSREGDSQLIRMLCGLV